MKRQQLLQSIFMFLVGMSLVSILFIGLAIESYPGGNFIDNNEEGFSFLYTAISDLGRINAFNEEPNDVARIFYTTAIDMFGVFVIIFHSIIWMFFQKRKVTKWLSIGGSVAGIVQGVLYIALAHAPPDTRFSAHINLIYTAPAFLLTSVIIYSIVFMIEKDFPRLNAYSYLVLIGVAVLLAIAVIIGSKEQDLVFHASRRGGHTLFNFIAFFIYGLQAIGAYIHVNRQPLKV